MFVSIKGFFGIFNACNLTELLTDPYSTNDSVDINTNKSIESSHKGGENFK